MGACTVVSMVMDDGMGIRPEEGVLVDVVPCTEQSGKGRAAIGYNLHGCVFLCKKNVSLK